MGKRKLKFQIDMKQYGMLIALIVIFLLFYILSEGRNATAMNINNLVMQNGYVVILAVGMLLCVLTGNIDLGVGSTVALTGAICAILVVDYGVPIPVAFLIVILVGIVVGMFLGIFIPSAAIKIPSNMPTTTPTRITIRKATGIGTP